MRNVFKTLISLSFVTLACLFTTAQSPNWNWAKSVGESGMDIGLNIATDNFGNVYTTGYYTSIVDFDPGAGISNLTAVGSEDVFLLKLDNAGNFIWAISVGGPNIDVARSIAIDNIGNVFISGYFQGVVDFDPGAATFNLGNAGVESSFVFKLNSLGDFIWAKAIGNSEITSMVLDINDNVYFTGSFNGTADFDPGAGSFTLTSLPVGNSNSFYSKLDSAGNFVWANSFIGSATPKALAVDNMSNIYIVGDFEGLIDFDLSAATYNLTATFGAINLFVSKLDSAGDFVWAKAMLGLNYSNGRSIALDGDNNVYTTGYFIGSIDLDPDSATQNFDSFDQEEDVFISKLDSAGNYVWGKTFGGVGPDICNSIAVDDSANVYTTGMFRFITDFDPGVGIYNMTPIGNFSIFVSKLDSTGNFRYATFAGGTGSTEDAAGRSLAIDNDNLYVAGTFGCTTISFGTNTLTNASSWGDWDIFVAKLSNTLTGIETISQTQSIYIYPNPSEDFFTIYLQDKPKNASVTITDVAGKIIYSYTLSGIQKLEVNLKYFSSGMYFCVICADGNSITKKLVKN